jgi:membrane-associated phospholipid phosphatase
MPDPQSRSFIARRLDFDDPFGLHLTLSVVLTVLTLAIFALLAAYALRPSDLTQLDARLSSRLEAEAHEAPTLTRLVFGVTTLGNGEVLATVGGSVALILLALMVKRRRHYMLAACWIIAATGGAVLNHELKAFFQRQRPQFEQPFVHLSDYSFPSGHAMSSLIIYGMLAYLLVLAVPKRWLRVTVVGVTALLVLAIGCSRPYLGAHWPSDVAGGFTVGAAWLTLCITPAEIMRRRGSLPSPPPDLAGLPAGGRRPAVATRGL